MALTGYVAIEAIGVRNALFSLAVAAFALALYANRSLPDPGARWSPPLLGLAAAGAVAALVLIPLRGSVPLIVHSVIYHQYGKPEILFYEEDEGISVSVLRYPGEPGRTLMINGLTASGLSPSDLKAGAETDVALASHPNPKTVFVAGTGSGKTSGVASLYGVDAIDSVEISRAAIAALPHFDSLTFSPSSNPVVNVIHGDARHYLRTTDKLYDIILPDVFISALTGTSYLYNQEFFELCADHLAENGRLVVQVDGQSPIDRSIIQGVLAAFPYVDYLRIPAAGLDTLSPRSSRSSIPILRGRTGNRCHRPGTGLARWVSWL